MRFEGSFGVYWREQIGHLRDQSGHHFGARRQNSSLQLRVGLETLWKTLSLLVVRRLIAKEQHQGREFESFPLSRLRFCAPNYDVARFGTLHGSAGARSHRLCDLWCSPNERYGTAAVGAKRSSSRASRPTEAKLKNQRMCSSPGSRGRRQKGHGSHTHVIQSASAGRGTARPSSL
jgi:hypothetical protein